MSAHAAVDQAHTVYSSTPHRLARLPLRAELFLLAHDDDSGGPHINLQSLAIGLAGAVLIELWLAQHVVIGWRFDPMRRRWEPEPGRITVMTESSAGETLADAALATIRRTRRDQAQLRNWLRTFAASDLYERVRADMLIVGLLRRTTRRRYGFVRTDVYAAADTAWAVRVRAQIRSVVHGFEHPRQPGRELPDNQCAALCGLAWALELTPFMYHAGMSASRFQQWLGHIANQDDDAIRAVIRAVDAGRGDLAVAAMG